MANDSLIDDIRAVRQKDNKATVVIDHVVDKYIPVGMQKDAAIEFLEKNGFKCVRPKPEVNKSGKDIVICKLDMKKSPHLGFGDEVVANLYFEEEAVHKVSAKIIYRAL